MIITPTNTLATRLTQRAYIVRCAVNELLPFLSGTPEPYLPPPTKAANTIRELIGSASSTDRILDDMSCAIDWALVLPAAMLTPAYRSVHMGVLLSWLRDARTLLDHVGAPHSTVVEDCALPERLSALHEFLLVLRAGCDSAICRTWAEAARTAAAASTIDVAQRPTSATDGGMDATPARHLHEVDPPCPDCGKTLDGSVTPMRCSLCGWPHG